MHFNNRSKQLRNSMYTASIGDEALCSHRTLKFQLLINFILLNFMNFIFITLKVRKVQDDNEVHKVRTSQCCQYSS